MSACHPKQVVKDWSIATIHAAVFRFMIVPRRDAGCGPETPPVCIRAFAASGPTAVRRPREFKDFRNLPWPGW
jgi:hypothetical protein